MKKNFEDKKYTLVVGSNGRLGKTICNHLLKNDKFVFGIDKKKSILKSQNYSHKVLDVTKSKNIQNFFSKNQYRFDNLIYSVYPFNNKWGKKFEDLDYKSLSENINFQLTSQIFFLKNFFSFALKKKFKVKVILISSIQGLGAPKFDHYKGLNMTSPIEYSAIKAATINITKYLAKYYRGHGFNINCISPGGIKDNQSPTFQKRYSNSTINKGLLNASDILTGIDFLLSRNSKYVNGQNIIIDDGWSI